jgi:uncharacterized caspase-like protein
MANNWAIVIGINQYRFLQPLKYAKRDAEAMSSFLIQETKFDRVFLFTDDSPMIDGKSTEPFRTNILRVLRQIFASPIMRDGDNFWFFFSGHGMPHNGQDYLMTLDGDPEDVENTGISTNTITNYLRSCGADNTLMILDACRSGGKKSGEGIGKQTEARVRQTGVISLFSCSPDQYSYELEAVEQGVFTYALLEALGIRGKCATLERLNQYLTHRVPELVNQHLQRVRQTPYIIAEPLDRFHLILMPKFANQSDIVRLKNDAYRAQIMQDWELAQRLWIRVNAVTSGQDMDAISALQNLGISRHTKPISTASNPSQGSEFLPMTRQKFLKYIVPTGIGVVGVTIIGLLFRRSPKTTTSPDSDTLPSRQTPQPSTLPTIQETDTPPTRPNIASESAEPLTTKKTNPFSVEYTRLSSLLIAGKWQDANVETMNLLLAKGKLEPDSIESFPCEVLSQIDRLWVENSDGKYGFSVQTKAYLEGSCILYDRQTLECFSNSVGWTKPGEGYAAYFGELINYPGHFPYISFDGEDGAYNQLSRYSHILQRLITCGI